MPKFKIEKKVYMFEESINPEVAQKINVIRQGAGKLQFEFPVEVVDSTTRTANGCLYSRPVLEQGLSSDLRTVRLMKHGGIPCEANHPIVKDLSTAWDFKRYKRTDIDKATHKIIKFYWEGEKLMALIRTSLINDALYNYILEGGTPLFSLRALGAKKFNKDGTVDALSFVFISLDWVDVNANEGSFGRLDQMTIVEKLVPLQVNHDERMAESIDSDMVNTRMIKDETSGRIIGLATLTPVTNSKQDLMSSFFDSL